MAGMSSGVWLIVWMCVVSDTPEQHPRISAEERDMIVTTIGVNQSELVRSFVIELDNSRFMHKTVYVSRPDM